VPPPNGDFSIIPPQLVNDTLINFKGEEFPKQSVENWEAATRFKFEIPGGNISFIAAQVWDDQPHAELDGIQLTPEGPVGDFAARHERVEVFGMASSYVWGSFLFKFETAYTRGKRQLLKTEKILEQVAAAAQQELGIFYELILNPDSDIESKRIIPDLSVKKGNVGINFGFDYNGISHLTLLFEVAGNYILKWEEDLASDEYVQQFAFNSSYSMLRDTLKLGYFVLFSQQDGSAHRIQMDYAVLDNLAVKLGVGIFEFDLPDSTVKHLTEQDRAYLGIKVSY